MKFAELNAALAADFWDFADAVVIDNEEALFVWPLERPRLPLIDTPGPFFNGESISASKTLVIDRLDVELGKAICRDKLEVLELDRE